MSTCSRPGWCLTRLMRKARRCTTMPCRYTHSHTQWHAFQNELRRLWLFVIEGGKKEVFRVSITDFTGTAARSKMSYHSSDSGSLYKQISAGTFYFCTRSVLVWRFLCICDLGDHIAANQTWHKLCVCVSNTTNAKRWSFFFFWNTYIWHINDKYTVVYPTKFPSFLTIIFLFFSIQITVKRVTC